jgi:transcriptional regulator with XRE-family HTH domain
MGILPGMSSRERPADRGARRGRQLTLDVIREYREARISSGISQQVVGKSLGRSDAWVSWTESGANGSLSIAAAATLLACVGLELSVRAFPAGRGIRDEAQLALLAQLKALVTSRWRCRTEVPIPIQGDLRAWDLVLDRQGLAIGIDAETRLRDLQALDRRVMLKQRDSQVDRAIILVADTRTNRETLRASGGALRANYPLGSREALTALVGGADPGANAIIMLSRPRPIREGSRQPDSSGVGLGDRRATATTQSLQRGWNMRPDDSIGVEDSKPVGGSDGSAFRRPT